MTMAPMAHLPLFLCCQPQHNICYYAMSVTVNFRHLFDKSKTLRVFFEPAKTISEFLFYIREIHMLAGVVDYKLTQC